jgi:aspartyl-tRNA(Asn)/glutamyl-tRNA(Gln) amidotransferase subunit A
MELCDYPAHKLVELIKSQQISAVDVVNSVYQRIEQVEGRTGAVGVEEIPEDAEKVHAFISLTKDLATQQAQEVDRKIANGEDPGPLAGVPFSAKDIFTVEGTLSTAASKILANFEAPYTATVVDRMVEAGAVMVGKVNLDEFTYGSSTESSAFKPVTRNPWDTSRVPGGSSGGSTASVAAGESTLSIGTDTGGSIRQPSSFCGVVGMKPTYGRVSRYGLIAFGSSLDCPGPIARNVTDAAMMLNAIAGQDPRDATTGTHTPPDYVEELKKGVKGLHVGISPDYLEIAYPNPETGEVGHEPLPDQVVSAVKRSAEVLADMGAEIVEDIPMPHTRYGIPVYFVVSRVEAASNLQRFDGVKYGHRTDKLVDNLEEMYTQTRSEGFGQEPKLRILMGMYISATAAEKAYYPRALRARTLIRADFEAAFEKVDVLLTPTAPTTAFPIGDVYGDSLLMQYADYCTVTANHAGIPGMSIPCGLDEDNLPIGLQLLGADYTEDILLRVARAFEQGTENEAWRQEKPQVLRGL